MIEAVAEDFHKITHHAVGSQLFGDLQVPTLSVVNPPINSSFVDNGNGTGTFDFNPGYRNNFV